MLHEFLTENRAELVAACRRKVAQRPAPKATPGELDHGVPIFLDQLIRTLCYEQGADALQGKGASTTDPHDELVLSQMGVSATRHGAELFAHEFTIDQVVHDYGDLCQAITELAMERKAPIGVGEFQVLNRSLDNAIADAVSEYAKGRSSFIVDDRNRAETERLGFFAHELRNLLHTATLALTAIKAGNVGLSGATGAVLDRSIVGMHNLIDRSLSDVRARAGFKVHRQTFPLADLITDVRVAAALEARVSGCGFSVSPVDPTLRIHADRDLLMSAIGNLLQNAFKFSRQDGEVFLDAYAAGDRILIDVSDRCGGLPPGMADKIFEPFSQGGENRSGLGLGLTIVKRSVEANGGALSVRDHAPVGCVFTIDLPQTAV